MRPLDICHDPKRKFATQLTIQLTQTPVPSVRVLRGELEKASSTLAKVTIGALKEKSGLVRSLQAAGAQKSQMQLLKKWRSAIAVRGERKRQRCGLEAIAKLHATVRSHPAHWLSFS